MTNPLVTLFQFFQRHKVAFYLFLLILILFMIVSLFFLSFQEDISGTKSVKLHESPFEFVVSKGKIAEKLIVTIHLQDTLQQPQPDSLEAFATQLLDTISTRFTAREIASVTGKVEDSSMNFFINLVYDHLPLYLTETDYRQIDQMLNDTTIEKRLQSNYKSLVSPAGFAMKGMILRDPLGIGYPALTRIKPQEIGENYILYHGFIMTKDQRNLILFITPSNPPTETSINGVLVHGLQQAISNIEKNAHPSIQASVFGSAAIAVGNAEQLKSDISLTLSISMLLIFLLIGWYYRSVKVPLLGFLPALFGGGLALSIIAITKGSISVIALGIGSVILGLIVDYSLYIVNHYRKKGDIEVVLKEMTLTIILCSLNAAGAFFCLIFLKSTVLHDLGLFAALSVLGAALFSLLILPQFLVQIKFSRSEVQQNTLIDKIASFQFEKSRLFIFLLLIALGVGILFAGKTSFERNMMSLNFTDQRLKQAEKDAQRISGGSFKNVYLVATGGDLNEALKNQEEAYQKLNQLKTEQVIAQYSGVGALLQSKEMQQEKIRLWNQFWNHDRISRTKRILLEQGVRIGFKGTAFSPFFSMLDQRYQPMDDSVQQKIVQSIGKEWYSKVDSVVMLTTTIKLDSANKAELYKRIPATNGIVLFDKQKITDQFIERVKSDFEVLVILSMVFVTGFLLFSFGRIELGLITAMPMFMSWLITLGFMGITGIHFNIFNIIISSFIFGLGVDYSILMMRSLQYRIRYGEDESKSYKVAVLLSSATTLFGVGALFFAKHPALNSIAMISVVGIVVVVLVSFTLVPLVINYLIIDRVEQGKFPVTTRIVIKTIITWGNIIFIAILMMLWGIVLRFFIPIPRSAKERWFHRTFSALSDLYIKMTFPPTARRLYNAGNEDFSKPAIIITNHQSLIETPGLLRLNPKILILTNTWVWNSLLFGPIARLASYYNVDEGIDPILEKLRKKTEEGYSILVFPEGHRSADHRIQRFHRGAFYLAEKLNLDILPIVQFGTGNFLPKGAVWGRPDCYYMKILPRVKPSDTRLGTTYSERTKQFRNYFKSEYAKMKSELGSGDYYRRKLALNYIYKSPVLEWYFRIKMRLSKNYELYNQLLPRSGKMTDLGCGYGFLTYMLHLTGDNRVLTGVDYDADKIKVASHGYLANPDVTFVHHNIVNYPIEPQDAFIFSDVLHYLHEEQQEALLVKCIQRLNPNGVILIREADRNKPEQHKGTERTEFFSTRVLAFNKTGDSSGLHFVSLSFLQKIADQNGMLLRVVEKSVKTSNMLLLLSKPPIKSSQP